MKTELVLDSSAEQEGRPAPDVETELRRPKKKDKREPAFLFVFRRTRGGSDEGKGRLNEEEVELLATSQLDNKGLM